VTGCSSRSWGAPNAGIPLNERGSLQPVRPGQQRLRKNFRNDSRHSRRIRPTPVVKGVKITLFLADGRPDGLRVVDQANWSGRGYDFARADWLKVRGEDELGKPGVYILSGQEDDGTQSVYVGEADELRSRLNQHYARVDFWHRATAFITKDDTLNKAGVKYLESRLLDLGHQAKRAELKNGNVPGLPSMSKADLAEAEGYLEHMLPILPILGLNAFDVIHAASAEADTPALVLKGSGISARGKDTAEGFIVEAGSTARVAEQPSIHEYVKAIRARLLQQGILVLDGAVFRLTQDQVFGSPSTAAGVLLGRPASGPMEWRDHQNRTLKQLRAAASNPSGT